MTATDRAGNVGSDVTSKELTINLPVTTQQLLKQIDGQEASNNNGTATFTLPTVDGHGRTLTYTAELVMDDNYLAALASRIDSLLGLKYTGSYYENWGGWGEKWILGNGGTWYFITPNGDLYK